MINMNLEQINTNKYIIGIAMITLTIGGRFIIGELTDKQKEKIDNSDFRTIFIFCSFFIATRDIIKSILLTMFFVIIIRYLVKENEEEAIEDNSKDEEEYLYENSFIYL